MQTVSRKPRPRSRFRPRRSRPAFSPRGRFGPANDAPELPLNVARLRVFAGVVLALIGILLARLWFLQILQGDHFREMAEANRLRVVRSVAPRGAIVDTKGRVLVTNQAQFTAFIVPTDLPPAKSPEREEVFDTVAGLLSMTRDELDATLNRQRKRVGALGKNDPIAIKEGVTMHELTAIAENQQRLPGVIAQAEPIRNYPQESVAAHVVGTIGPITERQLADKKKTGDDGYKASDLTGQSGIERQYDTFLHGTAGGTFYETDAANRRQRELRSEDPVPGATLRLTIDLDVQKAAERALGGRPGAAVALDPRDGRVLAFVSSPGYDPNTFTKRPLLQKVWGRLNDPNGDLPLLNRAISAQPPGSTFKIVTALAGLASGAITPSHYEYCAGGMYMGKSKSSFKRCHSTHGSVNLEEALEASCDVYFYRVGDKIGVTTLADWATKFALGTRTGIDLPGEYAGRMPTPEWKKRFAERIGHPENGGWFRGDTANAAIGQGDVLATPLQMALVAAGIANDGVIYRPFLAERAVSSDGSKIVYQAKPEVLEKLEAEPDQIAAVARGMRSVVIGGRGTSHAANLSGIAVAGKSGSAEVKRGGPTHAWFVCYAPFERPTIAICVFLDADGKKLHGGSDAAPVARAMMAAHFKVPNVAATTRGGSLAD